MNNEICKVNLINERKTTNLFPITDSGVADTEFDLSAETNVVLNDSEPLSPLKEKTAEDPDEN